MLYRILIFANLPFLLLFVALVGGYQHFLHTTIAVKPDSFITIEKGENLYKLLSRLDKQQLVNNSQWYKLLVRLNPALSEVKQGTYLLPESTSPKALLALFASGNEHQFKITLIEGENIWQVEDKLNANSRLSADDWSELKTDFGHLEGAFYPDTYAFTQGTSHVELLQRAHDKLVSVLNKAWQERQQGLPYKNAYEALIMASIIEKETSIASERQTIASVFVNRLRKGMRLQTDPTVIYGIGKDFDGDIKRADLRTATPYNTYVIDGLPPTPIALASEASIYAALNPVDSDYFYFVADANGEGHYFSKTLQEHNQAVQRYLKGTRAAG
jgi:UPF0755 protein